MVYKYSFMDDMMIITSFICMINASPPGILYLKSSPSTNKQNSCLFAFGSLCGTV